MTSSVTTKPSLGPLRRMTVRDIMQDNRDRNGGVDPMSPDILGIKAYGNYTARAARGLIRNVILATEKKTPGQESDVPVAVMWYDLFHDSKCG